MPGIDAELKLPTSFSAAFHADHAELSWLLTLTTSCLLYTSIMKKNHIGMPGGLSMLVRGLATVEGVVVDVAPGISVTQVATARISKKFLKDFDLRGNLQRDARALYESAYKALDIPALVSDTLRTGLKGDGRIGVDVHPGEDTEKLARTLVQKICAALVCAALILASAVGTSGQQVWIGLSWYQICLLYTSRCV